MSGISALTFTGNGGAAFIAGWSVLGIYLGNIAGFLVHSAFLAPWFRQLRVITFAEALRTRFGPATQQIYAMIGVVLFIVAASVWLLGLAIFSASAFGLPLHATIPVLGFVVLFYSSIGGKWAVLSTDFIQGLIMVGMTVLLSILCLIHAGGIEGFFAKIAERNLQETFAFVKRDGVFPDGLYTWRWVLATFTIQFISTTSLMQSSRYFAVKDGREARRAAILTTVLMALGTVLWFIPPMTARLFFEAEVLASSMPKPEEAAFAIVSLQFLPSGLVGMIVVAMFAATMSSVDSGLNGNAALLIRDILPAIRRRLGLPALAPDLELRWSKLSSVGFGLLIIGLALWISYQETVGIFQIALGLSATVVLPMGVPLLLCMFIRRTPPWACLCSMGAALVPSIIAYLQPELMSFGERVLWVVGAGVAGFLVTTPFPATTEYRARVDGFFDQMRRPVDFDREVGAANDAVQLLIMGRFTYAVAALFFVLLLVPNPVSGRYAILAIAMSMLTVAMLFSWRGRRGAVHRN